MKKTAIILAVLGAAVLASGLGYKWVMKQIELLTQTCWKISKIKIHEVSEFSLIATIDIQIKNLSDIALSLRNQVYEIYIDGVFVTKAKAVSPVRLKKGAVSTIPITISLSPDQIVKFGLDLIAKLISEPENIQFELTGTLDISSAFYTENGLRFEYAENLQSLIDSASEETIAACKSLNPKLKLS